MTRVYQRIPPEVRFWAKVDAFGVCWEYTGRVNERGYGIFTIDNAAVPKRAHRYAYELLVGPIPEGLTLDHLCRNRRCVNPDHCQPVTIGENVLRGHGFTARNAAKTACPRGHEYSADNTRVDINGSRHCRACTRIEIQNRKVRVA